MTAHYKIEGNVAIITLDNPPVNGLGFATRIGIVNGLAKAQEDKNVAAIVICGAGKAFSGGADINEFGSPKATAEPNLLTVIKQCEESSKPIVAAIHAVAMGGGLELAMGCHYRLSTADAQIALPEVKLGLLPGAGGTQRLPRLIGAEYAMNMIVKGDAIAAKKFTGTKLFDQIVESSSPADVLAAATAFAQTVLDKPLPKVRDLKVRVENADGYFKFAKNTVGVIAKNYPTPVFLIFFDTAITVAKTSLAVFSPRTISNNFITLAGEKKCIPTTACGRLVKLALLFTSKVEVLEAKIAPGFITSSNFLNTVSFTLISSNTASITKSAWAISA
jgi:3-hydroxyacyl-CoA dehydrogenase